MRGSIRTHFHNILFTAVVERRGWRVFYGDSNIVLVLGIADLAGR